MPLEYNDDRDALTPDILAFLDEIELIDDINAMTDVWNVLPALSEPCVIASDHVANATEEIRGNAMTVPQEPPRKRVHSYTKRRNELEYLRDHVAALERQLEQLWKRAADQQDVENKSEEQETRSSSIVIDAWEHVARRQYEQRHRAEVENAKLKRLLEEQINIGKALERVLTKRRPNELKALTARADPSAHSLPKDTAQDRFTELFASIESQYHVTTDVFAKVKHSCSSINHYDQQLVHDASLGMVVQTTECRIFPFKYEDTVDIVWDSLQDVTVHGPHHVEKTDGQQQIRVETTVSIGSDRSSMEVFIASRRYTESERTVIVSAAVIDPTEIADVAMDGVHMRYEGWTILEPMSSKKATRMKVYVIAVPVVSDSCASDHTRKTGALTNFVLNAHTLDRATRHDALENRLLMRSLGHKNSTES